jgi:two-component system, chemotaxis family, sensor kinase CheA
MQLQGKRIFIVEDNRENRSIMQLLLEREGAQVSFERWGTDAAERLNAFAPVDIILLDLMFPNNVTGYQVFDEIRKLSAYDGVPIVAVSAAEAEVAIPKAYDRGFAGFISKPIIDYELFVRQVASILNGVPVWYAG